MITTVFLGGFMSTLVRIWGSLGGMYVCTYLCLEKSRLRGGLMAACSSLRGEQRGRRCNAYFSQSSSDPGMASPVLPTGLALREEGDGMPLGLQSAILAASPSFPSRPPAPSRAGPKKPRNSGLPAFTRPRLEVRVSRMNRILHLEPAHYVL